MTVQYYGMRNRNTTPPVSHRSTGMIRRLSRSTGHTWRNKDLDRPPDYFEMSPNCCLPHSFPCPAGGARPLSAFGHLSKPRIRHWTLEGSKLRKMLPRHGSLLYERERERTIFERSRSSFKVLGPLISANLICDWGLGWNTLTTSCSLDAPCMRQCNLFDIRHPFAGNKNSFVLPRGSRSEEKVLPGVCVRQRGPPSRVDLGFLARLLFCIYKLVIVSKTGRKTVFMYSKKNFCCPYVR